MWCADSVADESPALTETVAAAHAPVMGFDEWHTSISSTFVPLDAYPGGRSADFVGSLTSQEMGGLQLCEVRGNRAHVRRSRRAICTADPGVLKVGLQLQGRSVIGQHGRQTVLDPGHLTVYDTSVEYDLHLTDSFSMLVVVIPRSSVHVAERVIADVAAREIGQDGTRALLQPLLMSVCSVQQRTSTATQLISEAITDLVGAAIRSAVPLASSGPGELMLHRARAFIEAHLGDTTLTPAVIAAHQSVSVRQLQKLFANDGMSVASYIRRRRLERCRRDLADRRHKGRSVSTICAEYGLLDASHFSRLFKQAYGRSPRQYRESQLTQPDTGVIITTTP